MPKLFEYLEKKHTKYCHEEKSIKYPLWATESYIKRKAQFISQKESHALFVTVLYVHN